MTAHNPQLNQLNPELHINATTRGVVQATVDGGLVIEFMRHCDLGVDGYARVEQFSLSPMQVNKRFGGFVEGIEALFLWTIVLDCCTFQTGSEIGLQLAELMEQYTAALEQIDKKDTH